MSTPEEIEMQNRVKKEEEEEDDDDGDDDDSDDDSDDGDDDSDVNPDDPQIQAIIADLEAEKDEEPEDLPKHKPKRKQKIKTILREFAQLSSTHGVDHMGEAHTIRVVMFWSFMLLLCAAAFGYLFSDTIIRFLKFEVVVQISMKNEERMFPAVTICNLNPYKKSELMNVPELAALVQAFEVAIGNA